MRRVFQRLAFVVAVVSWSSSCATEKPWLPSGQRREILDAAWTTIAERHYDPSLGGVDWNHVHEEVTPKVEHAANEAELRSAFHELTSALGQSHVNVLPPDAETETEEDGGEGAGGGHEGSGKSGTGAGKTGSGDGVCGLDVAGIEDAMLVIRVHPGSPAEAAGGHPRDRVVGAHTKGP